MLIIIIIVSLGGSICCFGNEFLGGRSSRAVWWDPVRYQGSNPSVVLVQLSQAKPSIRCFIKPTETLERSLEMNKHKGKRRVQKRPNYKNVGEEEDEEKGPAEDAQDDAEKAKGTEGGSKGIKTSGENEGECAASQAVICVWSPLVCQPVLLFIPDTCVPHSIQPSHLQADLVQGLPSPDGWPGVGFFTLNPCLSFPIRKKRVTSSIYFIIRIKWVKTCNMLRTVPGPCHKYLLLLLLPLLSSLSLSSSLFLLFLIIWDYDFWQKSLFPLHCRKEGGQCLMNWTAFDKIGFFWNQIINYNPLGSYIKIL